MASESVACTAWPFGPGRENLDLLRPHFDPWNSEVKSSSVLPPCAPIFRLFKACTTPRRVRLEGVTGA
jgi:hypothetical protein